MPVAIDRNVKPNEMSQLYWDYLKGKVKEEDLTQGQFNQIVLEKFNGYKARGGVETFEEFMSDIEITGL